MYDEVMTSVETTEGKTNEFSIKSWIIASMFDFEPVSICLI